MKRIIENSKMDIQKLEEHGEEVEIKQPNGSDAPLKVILKYIFQNDHELFTVYIDYWESDKRLNIRYIMNADDVHDVATMLQLLNLYKSFSNKQIEINGYKLFGDIIKGNENSWEFEDVDATISYWSRIHNLESLIEKKFKLHNPLSEEEIEKLEILSRSFVDKEPCRIGNLDNIVCDVSDREQLENLKGSSGNLCFVLNTPNEELCGVSLSTYYKAIFYGTIEIADYTILKETASGIKCQLKISPHKDAVAAIMYFFNKKDAEEFMSNKSDRFKNAAYIEKDISNPS